MRMRYVVEDDGTLRIVDDDEPEVPPRPRKGNNPTPPRSDPSRTGTANTLRKVARGAFWCVVALGILLLISNRDAGVDAGYYVKRFTSTISRCWSELGFHSGFKHIAKTVGIETPLQPLRILWNTLMRAMRRMFSI